MCVVQEGFRIGSGYISFLWRASVNAAGGITSSRLALERECVGYRVVIELRG